MGSHVVIIEEITYIAFANDKVLISDVIKSAERLLERILFVGLAVNVNKTNVITIGTTDECQTITTTIGEVFEEVDDFRQLAGHWSLVNCHCYRHKKKQWQDSPCGHPIMAMDTHS